MRLSAEALAACEEFHRTDAALFARQCALAKWRRRIAENEAGLRALGEEPRPSYETWAAVEAGYRARFVVAADESHGNGVRGTAQGERRQRAAAETPLPELPTRTSVRLLASDSNERRRAAARRARPC